ncbi:DUF4129 domain-containing protein [Rathayibacter sp. YIM 133350]|uniref:DUF4129 domain-containing protein n=1 Tax=Rathayibacter sp. YIM 133350 TaxID=3131992 RepID=UPI00307E7265
MRLPLDVPVDPDGPEARQWLNDELAKPQYQESRPNWFDQLSKAVLDWLGSLFSGRGDAGAVLPLVLTVIAVVLIAVALIVFGLPRLNRRAAAAGVFGEDDDRSAQALRRSARDAADAGDWSTAVLDAFRALARRLGERTILSVYPGTTADEVARQAGISFPDSALPLAAAASAFDAVRYLGRQGTEPDYRAIVALDAALEAARAAEVPA